MVMPLADEQRPRCYMCGEGFDDIEQLKEHRTSRHGGQEGGRGAAPGDVSVF